MRNIVHIDLNAFFAQCEENAHPEFKNKPIAIGRLNSRSVISTCNYEARKYGIHSAMPPSQAVKLCKDLILLDGHYSLYSKVSQQFMSFIKKRYKIVEVASIDECYIDMSQLFTLDEAEDYLKDLQFEILTKLHLKCSIGYSYTKFLAKMCSDYRKPMGLTICLNDDYKRLFWPMKIESMWGVGKKSAPKLRNLGITTIGELAKADQSTLESELGTFAIFLIDAANGRGSDILDTSSFNPKSMSSSITLLYDSDDENYLKTILSNQVKEVQESLLKYSKLATSAVLTLRDENFVTRSKRMKIQPSDDYSTLNAAAQKLFDSFYKSGTYIRLIGFGIDNSILKGASMPSLFDVEKDNPAQELVNELNEKIPNGGFKTLGELKK